MTERDPWSRFRREAIALSAEALHATYGLSTPVDDLVEEPDAALGDLALPCFAFAKELRKGPPQIAASLPEALGPSDLLDPEAKGPYLNFRIKPTALAETTLGSIRALGEDYGRSQATGTRVLLEHTSANPTGPLHVGRARNPLLADTLRRVLQAAGDEVTAEYYVNDMGRQAATLVWGIATFPEAIDVKATKADARLVRCYQRANEAIETEPEREAEVRALIGRFENGDEEAAHLFREAVAQVLAGIRGTLERAGVHHDNFKFESELVLDGRVDKVVEELRKHPASRDEDGALYLDMEALGVATEKPKMFLTRSDGTTLYGTRDIAYHQDKFARADALVNVLGEDHKLAMLELITALRLLGKERPLDVVFYNFVSLPEGKMSTRRGRVVYLDDLFDEAEARAYEEVKKRRGEELDEATMREVARMVGIGALRFNIVGVQSEKAITFRWEDALSFEGSTAPFVQYSHARTCSILAKAGLSPSEAPDADVALLTHPSEQALLRTLARFPGLVAEAARQRRVHTLTAYAVQVAGRLNDFYRDCRVLQADSAALRDARLVLVDATRQVLANTCRTIGIEAPRTM